MKPIHTLHRFLAALGASIIAISTAAAQTDGTWTINPGGTYDWFDTANWLDGNVASGSGATASFTESAGGNQTANLSSDLTLGNITLNRNQNLTISSLDGEILTLSGTPVFSVSSGRTLSILSLITGTDGIQKDGAGEVHLSGANTFSGPITITEGTLRAFQVVANAAFNNGPISLSSGGRLWTRGSNNSTHQFSVGAGGGILRVVGNNNFITTGNLTGSGTLNFENAGGGGARSANFNSTANDFTGGIIIDGGNSQLVQVNSLADSTNNIALNSNAGGTNTFRYGTGANAALTLDNRAFELNAAGAMTGVIDNANTTHAISVTTNLVATGAGAKTLTLSAAGAAANVFAGIIANETDGGSGTVGLTKAGAGTWTLTGANTYTGNTTVGAGTLTLADTSESRFLIGDIGVNNAILGTGTVNLDGLFVFDLTSASTTVGDFWNIVDVDSLSESYGSTFGVSSTLAAFSETATGVWNISENGQEYEFSQFTGVLTVIPEPGAALLGSLGLLMLLRRRR